MGQKECMLEPYLDFVECLLTPLLLAFMVSPRSTLEMCPLLSPWCYVCFWVSSCFIYFVTSWAGHYASLAYACIFERFSL